MSSNKLKRTRKGNSNSTSERREREKELTRRSYIVEFRETNTNNREAERAEREVISGNPSRCERRQVGDDHNTLTKTFFLSASVESGNEDSVRSPRHVTPISIREKSLTNDEPITPAILEKHYYTELGDSIRGKDQLLDGINNRCGRKNEKPTKSGVYFNYFALYEA